MEVELLQASMLLNCICVPVGGRSLEVFSYKREGAKLLQDDQ